MNKKLVKTMVATALVTTAVATSFSAINVLPASAAAPNYFTAPLEGTASFPQFMGGNRMLVNFEGEAGTSVLSIGVESKVARIVSEDPNAVEMVVSPDGKRGVYLDDLNHVVVVDLIRGRTWVASTNEDQKFELQFAAKDSENVYFIHGEKMNAIMKMDIATGYMTAATKDKADYRADLRINADATKFLYTVSKPGTVVQTADKSDVDTVDTTGTEPQLYLYDAATAAATQLTTSNDNKTFAGILADGRVAYVSSNTSDENAASTLKVVDAEKKVADLVKDVDVIQAAVSSEGKIAIIAYDKDEKAVAYEVAADGTRKVIYDKGDVTSIAFSPEGKSIALTVSTDAGEKVVVIENGQAIDITK